MCQVAVERYARFRSPFICMSRGVTGQRGDVLKGCCEISEDKVQCVSEDKVQCVLSYTEGSNLREFLLRDQILTKGWLINFRHA